MTVSDELKLLVTNTMSDKGFIKIIISSPLLKSNQDSKIIMEPKKVKAGLIFQAAVYSGNQVRHVNKSSVEDAVLLLTGFFETGYKQCQILMENETIHILMNKKGYTVSYGKQSNKKPSNITHDRQKSYIIMEGTYIPWLEKLGVMNRDGIVYKDMQKKFRQINKFLELVETVEEHIPEQCRILDIGCGKSYLTFALYYYFTEIKKRETYITGLDLKADVVAFCDHLAKECGFVNLSFKCQDAGSYFCPETKADMVVCLHACDTATDYAIYGGIHCGASVILAAPCCQHELFGQIKNESFRPILKHGALKERFSAILTDSLRASLLEASGYRCDCPEFIETEHTPKNIMLRAVLRHNENLDRKALEEYKTLAEVFGVYPTLYTLLDKDFK